MGAFPVLKTGAVIQVPASRVESFATNVVQFMDGGEQRFRTFAQPYHSWNVTFDSLDEAELNNIRIFFQQMNGAVGVFAFTDPWDGTIYPKCSIEAPNLVDLVSGPLQCSTKLTIRERRP